MKQVVDTGSARIGDGREVISSVLARTIFCMNFSQPAHLDWTSPENESTDLLYHRVIAAFPPTIVI